MTKSREKNIAEPLLSENILESGISVGENEGARRGCEQYQTIASRISIMDTHKRRLKNQYLSSNDENQDSERESVGRGKSGVERVSSGARRRL